MKKKALKRLLKEALAALAAGRPVAAAAPAGPSLAEWLPTYEQILAGRDYHEQTRRNRRANLGHLRRLWGAQPLQGLRPHAIATGLKTLSTATAGRVLSELRDLYNEAIANGAAESNPAAHVKPPRHRTIRARLDFTTWQQMRTLAQASPQRWVEPMLLLALVTGQRRGDLAAMRFDQIVTDERGQQFLRVEQQKKAGKVIGARVEIPLSLRLDAIGMTVGDVIEHCRAAGKPGPTMLRKAGGGPIEQSSLSARFHEHIVAVLGEDAHGPYEWPSLHEVRSLSARSYIAQGLKPATVQTLLGHADLEMTEVYVNDRGLSAHEWKRVEIAA